ncbi:MAG: 5-(carboxyamino)imidazole ribonucleotide mutase [Sphaerochaetaceae bacterium]
MQTIQKNRVAVLLGSEHDAPLVEGAFTVLRELDIPFEAHILSAHRSSEQTIKFAEQAASNGFSVLIAAAGKAAHLAGVLASRSLLPVIGIPLSASLGGMDALLSTLQMPSGYPVATVAIDGAANAALLAAQILALNDEVLASRLQKRREEMADKVATADERFQKSFTRSR